MVVHVSEDIPPEVHIDEKESQIHQLDSLSLLIYTFLLTVTVLTIWFFKHHRIRFLHETGLALFYGLIIGAIVRFAVTGYGSQTTLRVKPLGSLQELSNNTNTGPPDFLWLDVKAIHSKHARQQLMNKTLAYSFNGEVRDVNNVNAIDQKATFDPEIFFNILLPPIIFHAGYSMKRRFFFRNIGAILTFAFIGTTISTFAIGGIMYGITRMFDHLNFFTLLDTFRFGALISATDPVTILAIFTDLHVDVNLYAMVFGESVLNDAVAMVITRTLEDYEESSKNSDVDPLPSYVIFFRSLGEFIGIFGGSFLVGAIMGCCTALLTKLTQISKHPQLESTLFVLMSYSTFLIAEVLHLTGIVAVLSCGICQAHYTYNNLSNESRIVTRQFFGLLNFMAENFIFSYVGVSMFTFPKHNFDPIFIVGSFLAIIVGRAINIYPLSFLLNLGRRSKITWNLQHMLFLSGLRGAIAFALAIRNTLTDARQMILTATLVIVMVTVVLCGGSTLSLLTWLGIPLGIDDDDGTTSPLSPSSGSSPQHYNTMSGLQPRPSQLNVSSQPAEKSIAAKAWSGFDTKYMKPFLTHSNPTLMETLPGCCLPFATALTSTDQMSRHPAMMRSADQLVNDEEDVINDDTVVNAVNNPSAGGATAITTPPNGSSSTNNLRVEGSPKKELKHRLPSHI